VYRIRPWLYIGKYRETTQLDNLRAYQIGAMLQLAEPVEQPGIESLYLQVEDGEPLPTDKLRRGMDFVRLRKADGHNVLVACGAGISRSTSFAIAALKEEEQISLVDAYSQILDCHPEAMPHPALWESLRVYYEETTSYQDLWDVIHQLRRNGKQ
jgi:protein-tyrosine phosphatase